MTDPSSMTSVTEEDNTDESDTTETSCVSKASDCMSSILYSSECNTDDKLTPGLIKISISKRQDHLSKKGGQARLKTVDRDDDSKISSTSPPFPHNCNALPLKGKCKGSQPRKKQRRSLLYHSLSKSHQRKPNLHKQSLLPKQEEENFGVDDPGNCLYTDFSDTSSVLWTKGRTDQSHFSDDDNSLSDENELRPFYPDMTTDTWFQAKCFDCYWSHYSFVMDWYQQHIQAISLLGQQMAWNASQTSFSWTPSLSSHFGAKKRSSRKRSKRRARNRRLAKAKQKAYQEAEVEGVDVIGMNHHHIDNEENEIEMEITEEMMDFFATSFKHRLERGIGDCQGSSLIGPPEQPGVRRTAEMKLLYGVGAPMIQGMETALQMTYDKVLDKFQPKLWPNMPLKIVFT